MSIHCIECGYKMKTIHAIISTMAHEAKYFTEFTNQEIGKAIGFQCPECGTYGHWKKEA